MNISNTAKRSKKAKVVNYNGFSEAFDNLPNKFRATIRRELQKRLGWSISSFYYKRAGDSPLRENEVSVLEEVFKRFDLNPWTGERL